MSAKLRHLKRGFTLVELMIVVAIVGILAALAVYGVSRYVKNAKTAEARDALGRMGKDAVGAFQRETMAGSVLALGGSAAVIHALCASAPPVPGDVPKAAKYQSKPSEWLESNWACLRFSMNEPQYFQYEYQSPGGDSNGTIFTCIAKGDLDGDGADYSQFQMNGSIQMDGNKKVASLAPAIEGDVNE
jgi:type IV pilus assembly protein PilA